MMMGVEEGFFPSQFHIDLLSGRLEYPSHFGSDFRVFDEDIQPFKRISDKMTPIFLNSRIFELSAPVFY